MGFDTYLDFYVGVPVSLLAGKPKQKIEYVTRYRNVDGSPYQEKVFSWFTSLTNETEVNADDLSKHFKELGFDCGGCCDNFFLGVAGKKVGKHDSRSGSQTMALPIPTGDEITTATETVKKLFKDNQFPDTVVNAVQLYAVVDASY